MAHHHDFFTGHKCNTLCYTYPCDKDIPPQGTAGPFRKRRIRKGQCENPGSLSRRLDVIDNAKSLEELNLPGYRLHRLEGRQPLRYAVDVNGPWRITFEWYDGDAFRVDLEQYH